MLFTKTSYFMKTMNYRPRKLIKIKEEPLSQVFYMWQTVTPMLVGVTLGLELLPLGPKAANCPFGCCGSSVYGFVSVSWSWHGGVRQMLL